MLEKKKSTQTFWSKVEEAANSSLACTPIFEFGIKYQII
jgi:hypothetical protein